jgi:hypothetical protein
MEPRAPPLPPFTLFPDRATGAKKSPLKRQAIILLVKKLTTFLKSPAYIFFQNSHNKGRFPGRLGKSLVEEKEVEKVVGDEDKQDNAQKHPRLFSSYKWLTNDLVESMV